VHSAAFEFGLLGVLHFQVHLTTGLGNGVCIWDGARRQDGYGAIPTPFTLFSRFLFDDDEDR